MTSSLILYKSRADEYFGKLEQAEIAVLKASRAEQFAKTQAREADDTCAAIVAERKQTDRLVEDLQRQTQQLEERVEDVAADLEGAVQAKKRLQNELEDYRSQRAIDLEDTETSIEQTRKKYQAELTGLSHELELERENVIYEREENGRLREEMDEVRAKWDDEVVNSSTWAKEKSRLELTLQDLARSRDEAAHAHHEAQSKVVSLLSQVRTLRTDVDEAVAERDAVVKEKKSAEARLQEAASKLEHLARSESPSMRSAAAVDRELLELKSSLAQQEDIAAAAVGKMRRAEALAQELQKDMVAEREQRVQLHKDKAALEKLAKDVQLRLVDLEARGLAASASQDVRFLHGRINELERALEAARRDAAERVARRAQRRPHRARPARPARPPRQAARRRGRRPRPRPRQDGRPARHHRRPAGVRLGPPRWPPSAPTATCARSARSRCASSASSTPGAPRASTAAPPSACPRPATPTPAPAAARPSACSPRTSSLAPPTSPRRRRPAATTAAAVCVAALPAPPAAPRAPRVFCSARRGAQRRALRSRPCLHPLTRVFCRAARCAAARRSSLLGVHAGATVRRRGEERGRGNGSVGLGQAQSAASRRCWPTYWVRASMCLGRMGGMARSAMRDAHGRAEGGGCTKYPVGSVDVSIHWYGLPRRRSGQCSVSCTATSYVVFSVVHSNCVVLSNYTMPCNAMQRGAATELAIQLSP